MNILFTVSLIVFLASLMIYIIFRVMSLESRLEYYNNLLSEQNRISALQMRSFQSEMSLTRETVNFNRFAETNRLVNNPQRSYLEEEYLTRINS